MYRSSPSPLQTRSCQARPVDFFPDYRFFFCRSYSVVLISQFSLAWGKTLSSATFVSIFTSLSCITLPLSSKLPFFIFADSAFYSDCYRPCHLFRLRHPLFFKRRSGDASRISSPSLTRALNRNFRAPQIHVGTQRRCQVCVGF